MSTRRGREPQGLRLALLTLRGVYSPTHYYVRVSRAAILHRHRALLHRLCALLHMHWALLLRVWALLLRLWALLHG